jgi:hypothetical protein
MKTLILILLLNCNILLCTDFYVGAMDTKLSIDSCITQSVMFCNRLNIPYHYKNNLIDSSEYFEMQWNENTINIWYYHKTDYLVIVQNIQTNQTIKAKFDRFEDELLTGMKIKDWVINQTERTRSYRSKERISGYYFIYTFNEHGYCVERIK